MKTLYNVFVNIKSEKHLDKLIAQCKEYNIDCDKNLPFSKKDIFRVGCGFGFGNWHHFGKKYTEVTESEFLELLKKEKQL